MNKTELLVEKQEQQLRNEIQGFFVKIKAKTSKVPDQLLSQVDVLFDLRSEIYEDLNQLQHQSLILVAAKIIKIEIPEIDRWTWHPKQTSSVSDADLTGYINSEVIVNAEVTTSRRPIGTIDKRMQSTLLSLSTKTGVKFYFVQTEEMLKRAKHKIKKNNWHINCIKINRADTI